jgi:hypothetical protein
MEKNSKILWAMLILFLSMQACKVFTRSSAANGITNTAQENMFHIEDGDFSLTVPEGFKPTACFSSVTLNNDKKQLSIYIDREMDSHNKVTFDQIEDNWRNIFNNQWDYSGTEFNKPVESTINGVKTWVFEFKTKQNNQLFSGQAFIMIPRSRQYLFGFGLLPSNGSGLEWKNSGAVVFNTLIHSIVIEQNKTCDVSTDLTYGVTKENPIRIGGNAFKGYDRIWYYLENLLSAGGEELMFTYMKTDNTDDAILDTYLVTGLQKQVILYIDKFSVSDIKAPSGFSCSAEFSFEPPVYQDGYDDYPDAGCEKEFSQLAN